MTKSLNKSVSDADIFRAIDMLYETALEPTEWTGLLRTIGQLVGAPQGSLVLMSVETNHVSNYGFGRNENFIAVFNSEFANQDRWLEPVMRLGTGTVVTGQELCPTPSFEHSAYYEECLKLGEIYDCLGVMLEMGHDLNAGISLHRPRFLPVFDDSEKAALRLLVPHLRRLVQIHRKFDSLSATAILQTEVLNRLSFGVVVVGGGSIQFVNRATREIAAACDGLRLSSKGVTADNAEDNAALVQAQKLAARPAWGNSPGPRGSTVAVRRLSLKRPYTVHIMPMSDRVIGTTRILGDSSPALLITITDPTSVPRPAADVLMHAYGLTPTEAALALKIGEGASLKEAAEQLAISEQTARWHLKNVLAKTETSRQSDLVRLLLSSMAPVMSQG